MAHTLHRIKYRHLQPHGEWFAEDDYRHKGYGPDWFESEYLVVAPTEELALAQFWHGHGHLRGEAKISVTGLTTESISCIVSVKWND